MIYFTAHTFKCVCHCRRAMFRVLNVYNFVSNIKHKIIKSEEQGTKADNFRTEITCFKH